MKKVDLHSQYELGSAGREVPRADALSIADGQPKPYLPTMRKERSTGSMQAAPERNPINYQQYPFPQHQGEPFSAANVGSSVDGESELEAQWLSKQAKTPSNPSQGQKAFAPPSRMNGPLYQRSVNGGLVAPRGQR